MATDVDTMKIAMQELEEDGTPAAIELKKRMDGGSERLVDSANVC